jgi:sugar phosphate isomerase/epimerase
MKFALVTTDADLAAAASRAKDFGFDALEVPAGDAPVAGLPVACVTVPTPIPFKPRDRAAYAEQLDRAITFAAQSNCRLVNPPGAPVHPGQSLGATAADVGRWLRPLADAAAARDVTLVVENALAFRKSQDLWTLLESVDHPAVAAAWDLANAAEAGESPAVSVPTLNSRIRYVRLRVDPVSNEHATRQLLTRLRGVGFTGHLAVQLPPELLGPAVEKLKAWTLVVPAKPKKPTLVK